MRFMRPNAVISGQWFWHSIAPTILGKNGGPDSELLMNRWTLLCVSLGVTNLSDSNDKGFMRGNLPTSFGSEAGGPVAY